MALKGKQVLFVEEYLKTFNATQAALAAGYSPKTAYSIGWENLRKPEVSQAISRRLSESAMTSDEVLMRQAEIARSDIGEFLTQTEDGEVSIRLTDAQTNAPKRTHLIKRVTQRKVVRTVKDMTKTVTTLTYGTDGALIRSTTGVYYFDLDVDTAGDWYYGFYSTGVGKAASPDKRLPVLASKRG